MATSYTCTLCGDPTKPCCIDAKGTQSCTDGQTCVANMCPKSIDAGWSGQPCGTVAGQPPCQGKLACDATTKTCGCVKDSEWLQCSADNKSVCAPGGSGPTPAPPSGGGIYDGDCNDTQAAGCSPDKYVCFTQPGKTGPNSCSPATGDAGKAFWSTKGNGCDGLHFCHVKAS